MTAAEKIIEGIISQANEQAQIKINDARTAEQKALELAKEEAEKLSSETVQKAHQKAELIRSTGESSARLYVRDASLACRRREIDRVLSSAVDCINAFGDDEYFDFLIKIVQNNGSSGILSLARKDSSRDTSAFEKKLLDMGVEFGGCTAEINGGFILKNGDIEINAEIDALIRERRDELADSVNAVLFE